MTAPSPITGSSDPAAPQARPRSMTPPASDERRSRTAPRTRRPSAAPASDAPSPTSTTRNDCASAAGCSPADPGPSTRSTDGSRRWSRCSSSPSGPTAAGSPALTRRSRRSRTSRPPARSSARCSTSRPGASGTSRGPSPDACATEALRVHAHHTREEIVVGMRHDGFRRRPDAIREGVLFSEPSTRTRCSSPCARTRRATPRRPCTATWRSPRRSSTGDAVDDLGGLADRPPAPGAGRLGRRDSAVRPRGPGQRVRGRRSLSVPGHGRPGHEGSRPVGIDWRLREPMPAEAWTTASVARP